MADSNSVDESLRTAADPQMPPIRWERVASRTRRRNLLGLIGLLIITAVFTGLIAAGVMAGRNALDPTFTSPIFPRSTSSAVVDRSMLGRRLVSLESYEGYSGVASTSRVQPQLTHRGYALNADLHVSGLRGDTLVSHWCLRRVGSPKGAISTRTFPRRETFVPRSDDETRHVGAWIEAPRHSGLYVTEVELVSLGGERVSHSKSKPFTVVAGDYFAPYKAASYTALLPKDWQLESSYELASRERYVTLALGPGNATVTIDTTLNSKGDPAEDAKFLEGPYADGAEPYRRLIYRWEELGGRRSFDWSFRLGKTFYTDTFFYLGGNGYAVLGTSPASNFRETHDITRDVARSVASRTPIRQ